MRLASKQQLRKRISELRLWIEDNPGKFDGITERLRRIKEIEEVWMPEAPEEGEIKHA